VAAAVSSGAAIFFSQVAFSALARIASTVVPCSPAMRSQYRFSRSVSIPPGTMQLTRIPWGPSSRAATLVSRRRPPLATV
jgi:hypothetical protein